MWFIERPLLGHQFLIEFVLIFVSKCSVCFASFDVVCDEFDNGV